MKITEGFIVVISLIESFILVMSTSIHTRFLNFRVKRNILK